MNANSHTAQCNETKCVWKIKSVRIWAGSRSRARARAIEPEHVRRQCANCQAAAPYTIVCVCVYMCPAWNGARVHGEHIAEPR